MDTMKVDLLLKKLQNIFFQRSSKFLPRSYSNGFRTSPFFLFEKSQQIWLLEASKVSAKIGLGWQADRAMVKILLSNLRKHVMNKCWKFQADILIHFWFRRKRLKIRFNQWPPNAQMGPYCALGGHWLQQIFSYSAITLTRINRSSWNF